MKDSVTYQGIVEEGVVKGQRQTLLDLGRIKFGPPTQAVAATLNGITDPDRLAHLLRRLLAVSSWDELLSVP